MDNMFVANPENLIPKIEETGLGILKYMQQN
jgi:hypothetical protein